MGGRVPANRPRGAVREIEEMSQGAPRAPRARRKRSGGSDDFAGKVRTRREELGIALEGQIGLPEEAGDLDRFRRGILAARDAGAKVLRTVCLGGRRYEVFADLAAWKRFKERSWNSLTMVEPLMRGLGLKLAVENHKDWRTEELLDLLQRLESEAVGVTFDFGNSLALLEDPHEVCEALAPFIHSTHVKDMGVEAHEDGFLLSEVPLGDGLLDLKRLVRTRAGANPAVQFNPEMITRDPLLVPVLSEKYWTTMEKVPGPDLARALHMVRRNPPVRPLPRVTGKSPEERLAFEDDNVRRCFAYGRRELAL